MLFCRRALVLALFWTLVASTSAASSNAARRASFGRRLAALNPSIDHRTFARKWLFRRQLDEEVPEEIINKRIGPIASCAGRKVQLNDDLTVDLGNGERGIWNFKNKDKTYLEMEFDLREDESSYLLYQVDLSPGIYNANGVVIGEGSIYLVKNHLPFDWNKKLIGKFGMELEMPPPIIQ